MSNKEAARLPVELRDQIFLELVKDYESDHYRSNRLLAGSATTYDPSRADSPSERISNLRLVSRETADSIRSAVFGKSIIVFDTNRAVKESWTLSMIGQIRDAWIAKRTYEEIARIRHIQIVASVDFISELLDWDGPLTMNDVLEDATFCAAVEYTRELHDALPGLRFVDIRLDIAYPVDADLQETEMQQIRNRLAQIFVDTKSITADIWVPSPADMNVILEEKDAESNAWLRQVVRDGEDFEW